MTKRVCQASILMFVLAAPAMAQRDRGGPGWLARRCVATIHQVAERTVHQIGHRTHACIRQVNALLDEGSEAEARAAALRCTESIENTAQRVTNRIEQIATRCVALLTEHEAPEDMIASVRQAAREAIGAVNAAANRAVQAIRGLFGE